MRQLRRLAGASLPAAFVLAFASSSAAQSLEFSIWLNDGDPAVLGGAALVRTHDVAGTLDAIRVAERIRHATMARGMDAEGTDR